MESGVSPSNLIDFIQGPLLFSRPRDFPLTEYSVVSQERNSGVIFLVLLVRPNCHNNHADTWLTPHGDHIRKHKFEMQA